MVCALFRIFNISLFFIYLFVFDQVSVIMNNTGCQKAQQLLSVKVTYSSEAHIDLKTHLRRSCLCFQQ